MLRRRSTQSCEMQENRYARIPGCAFACRPWAPWPSVVGWRRQWRVRKPAGDCPVGKPDFLPKASIGRTAAIRRKNAEDWSSAMLRVSASCAKRHCYAKERCTSASETLSNLCVFCLSAPLRLTESPFSQCLACTPKHLRLPSHLDGVTWEAQRMCKFVAAYFALTLPLVSQPPPRAR
jgi:hypothetical protein